MPHFIERHVETPPPDDQEKIQMEALLTLAEAALVPEAGNLIAKNTSLTEHEKQNLEASVRMIDPLYYHQHLADQVKESPYEMRELAKTVVITEIQRAFAKVAKEAADHRKIVLVSEGDAILEKIRKISL